MEENVSKLIYQAVYIIIFITATSITINLFQTINTYTESVANSVKADSISEAIKENEDMFVDTINNELEYTITGYELFALVNNYGLGHASWGGEAAKKYNNVSGDPVVIDSNIVIYVNGVSSINNIKLNAIYEIDKNNTNYSNVPKVICYRQK